MRTALALALATAAAQPSNSTYYGMYKATWATSDPIHTTYPFLTELLGNLPTDNNCPNLTCACGTQGRTELNGTHGFGSEDHFGVHTVEAAGVNGAGSARRAAAVPALGLGVRWVAVDEVRHRFEDGPPAVAAGRLEPLHVSRFAADLDVIEVFYDRVSAKPSAADFPLDEADPTSKRLVYGGPGSFTPDVALVFVTRAEPRTARAPRPGDNHVAVQMNRADPGADADDAAANLDAMGWHLHHPFKGACKAPGDCGPSDIYLMDPSGWTTQLVSPVGFKNTTPRRDADSAPLAAASPWRPRAAKGAFTTALCRQRKGAFKRRRSAASAAAVVRGGRAPPWAAAGSTGARCSCGAAARLAPGAAAASTAGGRTDSDRRIFR
ncbi:hypothetical protein JL720_15685 [Aureococcus anophagefferens]|nr:hypothetical protein JL720_15685 [Aureococcus anophagefferens]